MKQASVESVEFLRTADKGRPVPDQMAIQGHINYQGAVFSTGHDAVVKQKAQYDKLIEDGPYDEVRFLAIMFPSMLPFACTGMTFPEYDFAGNGIQGPETIARPEFVCFSVFGTDNGSAAVFSWLHSSNRSASQLAKSLPLDDDALLVEALWRYGLAKIENFFISPAWWDAAPESDKICVEELILTGVATDRIREATIPTGANFRSTGYGPYSIKWDSTSAAVSQQIDRKLGRSKPPEVT